MSFYGMTMVQIGIKTCFLYCSNTQPALLQSFINVFVNTTLCLFLLNIQLVYNDMVLVFAKPLKPLKVLDDKDHGGRASAPTFERRMNFRLKTLKSFFSATSIISQEGGRRGRGDFC